MTNAPSERAEANSRTLGMAVPSLEVPPSSAMRRLPLSPVGDRRWSGREPSPCWKRSTKRSTRSHAAS